MTNASAMTLVWLLFVGLLLAAVFVILCGGGHSERVRQPHRRDQHPEHFDRAA